MRFHALLAATAPLPLLALGAHIRRQDTASASSVSSGSATASPSASASAPPEVPFTLISSNPTAFPLSAIVATPATHTTIPLEWTFTAGQEPTAVTSNAPPLPTGKSTPSSKIISCFAINSHTPSIVAAKCRTSLIVRVPAIVLNAR